MYMTTLPIKMQIILIWKGSSASDMLLLQAFSPLLENLFIDATHQTEIGLQQFNELHQVTSFQTFLTNL